MNNSLSGLQYKAVFRYGYVPLAALLKIIFCTYATILMTPAALVRQSGLAMGWVRVQF